MIFFLNNTENMCTCKHFSVRFMHVANLNRVWARLALAETMLIDDQLREKLREEGGILVGQFIHIHCNTNAREGCTMGVK